MGLKIILLFLLSFYDHSHIFYQIREKKKKERILSILWSWQCKKKKKNEKNNGQNPIKIISKSYVW